MIITIAGMIGSGKSTVADELAKKIKYKRYSSGDFMKTMAKERGKTLEELSIEAETNSKIDEEIDKRQIEFAKTHDNYVIDGRLSWFFMPDSIKIYLDVSLEEAGKRIYSDKKESRKVEQASSIEEIIKKIKRRKKSEIKRYKRYGVNIHNRKNYDIYLDTTNRCVKEEIDYLLNEIKNFPKINKNF